MAEIIKQGIVPVTCFKRGVSAAYTTREGGFSLGAYASFNLGAHVGDDPARVRRNRNYLEAALGRSVVFMNQTHGCEVKKIAFSEIEYDKSAVDADGIFTSDRALALAVMTADCLPLLLSLDDLAGVCAVHCGWRGLAGGIVSNAVNLMRKQSKAAITAYLGPAIGPQSFEVGSELKAVFERLSPRFSPAFKPKGSAKYLCDLYKLCSMQLLSLGVSNIHCDYLDTFKDQKLFFSYRRSKITGRMVSVVSLD